MRRVTISSRLAVATVVFTLGAVPGVAAGQQPDRPGLSSQDDITNPPSGAGGPPSGEQNRRPAAGQDRDPRGNDRDLTIERGDGPERDAPTGVGTAGQDDGAERANTIPVVVIALAAVGVLAIVAFMRTRRRSVRSDEA
jgi:hypothetical protein